MKFFKAQTKEPFHTGVLETKTEDKGITSDLVGRSICMPRTTFLGEGMDVGVMLPQILKLIDAEGTLNLQGLAHYHGKEINVWLLLNRQVLDLIEASEVLGERKLKLNLPDGVTWEMMSRSGDNRHGLN